MKSSFDGINDLSSRLMVFVEADEAHFSKVIAYFFPSWMRLIEAFKGVARSKRVVVL